MKTFGIYEAVGKPVAIEWAKKAMLKLHSLGAGVIICPELFAAVDRPEFGFAKECPVENFEKFADLVISFGGDGSMLSLARNMIKSDIPILGFNVGKLGFLAEYSVENLDSALEDIIHGKYRVVHRSVLQTTYYDETFYALNDFVIDKLSTAMIIVSAFSGEKHIGDFRADGLIISTPTGSTAYSLSCGGPIISPAAGVICITPIAPHSLTMRPIVVPDNIELNLIIHSASGPAKLVSDGQIERHLAKNDMIKIRKSESEIMLVKPTDTSYYELLRDKLLWTVDVAVNKSKK